MYSEFQSQIQSLSNGQSEGSKREVKPETISAKKQVYERVEHEQDSLYQQYSQENQFRHYNIESREHDLKQQHGQDEGNFSFDEDLEQEHEPEIVESYEQDLSTFERAIGKEPVIMQAAISVQDQNDSSF